MAYRQNGGHIKKMQDAATHILEAMCREIFKEKSLAYFILDGQGNIRQWGGRLSDLNLALPEAGTPVSDILIFMEGILPIKISSMTFSCIKVPKGACLDAYLFRIPQGFGLIVWDASEKEKHLSQTQQKYNELSLLIEKQKNKLAASQNEVRDDAGQTLLEDLFQALDFVVMEMNPLGHFVLIGTPPAWIEQMSESGRVLSDDAYEEDVFSFLGNFIQAVKNKWLGPHENCIRSGVWIETDQEGQELMLEAMALDIRGRKLLTISRDICRPREKQHLIQKGRDLALTFHDLKRSGQKLMDMRDELELRVKERTQDLEDANRKLANELIERKRLEKERKDVSNQLRQAQKMEAIGTLAGGIAHDFNNILSAIIGFSELSIVEADKAPDLRENLGKILDASERAKKLVRQILTFSHQTEYEKKPLKLEAILSEVLHLLRASLPALIDIHAELDSDAYILADPTQIHQVIMNLCTNAWYAMKETGGTLNIRLAETDILPEDLSAYPELPPGRYLLLSVKDTGHGIRPELIEKIFDPYFTTKDKDKGTGLGLSVVHGIVSKCGGAITVKSQLGKGSEFKVLLPVFDAQNEPQSIKDPLVMGNQEKILFVDDEPFQTELAIELLNRLGYSVTVCSDGIQALELFLADEKRFDLVITDMIMPKMSGKTLARRILEIRPDIPVILCSGYSDDIHPDTVKEIGISQYLMKPVGMQELSQAVRTALEQA